MSGTTPTTLDRTGVLYTGPKLHQPYITPALYYTGPLLYWLLLPTFNLTTNHGQNYRYFRPCFFKTYLKSEVHMHIYLCSMHEIQWYIKFSQGTDNQVSLKYMLEIFDQGHFILYEIENITVMTYFI